MSELTKNEREYLYTEKYRPRSISECILPDDIQAQFLNMVANGDLPNLLLTGKAGTGKTTVAKALCEDLGRDYLFLNASENNGIDVLRTTIRDFASTVSMSGGSKVVILDEADNMSAALQPALRGFIEEFSTHCRFILSCNYKNKIITEIHSRLNTIEFKIDKKDQVLSAKFFKRLVQILKEEQVTFDQKVLAKAMMKHFPDFRKTLVQIQGYVIQTNGQIDEGILSNTVTTSVDALIAAIREKDFRKARTWLVENSDIEPVVTLRMLYDTLVPQVREAPELIRILAETQKFLPWVTDTEIHMAAMFIDIMALCTFKDA